VGKLVEKEHPVILPRNADQTILRVLLLQVFLLLAVILISSSLFNEFVMPLHNHPALWINDEKRN
jgi:hypothetical protein